MVTIDLDKPADNQTEFFVLRSEAIGNYAALEQSLSNLLATLLDTGVHLAGIIFFQIANTKSRNRIIEDLLKQRFSDTYSHFWNGIPKTPHKRGLMNLVQFLDGRRNELVHWHAVNHIHVVDDNHATRTLSLAPPTFWQTNSEIRLTTEDIREFIRKADFVSRSINMFNAFISPQMANEHNFLSAWREIFQRPCIYPPPDSHPLSPNYKGPQIPPQPSGA